MAAVKYAKSDYTVRERIEGDFEHLEDMKAWTKDMRARGYKTNEEEFGSAVGATYRAVAIRRRVRKTFDMLGSGRKGRPKTARDTIPGIKKIARKF